MNTHFIEISYYVVLFTLCDNTALSFFFLRPVMSIETAQNTTSRFHSSIRKTKVILVIIPLSLNPQEIKFMNLLEFDMK